MDQQFEIQRISNIKRFQEGENQPNSTRLPFRIDSESDDFNMWWKPDNKSTYDFDNNQKSKTKNHNCGANLWH